MGLVTQEYLALEYGLRDLTWEEFTTQFRERYEHPVEIGRETRDNLALKQTIKSVMEIIDEFMKRGLFFPKYDMEEKMKMSHESDMLKTKIREFVIASKYWTLGEIDCGMSSRIEVRDPVEEEEAGIGPNTIGSI